MRTGMDLYAYCSRTVNPAQVVASLPAHVNGVSVEFGWSDLQPSIHAAPNFAKVDAFLNAVTDRKHLYLHVQAGQSCPDDLPNQATVPAKYFQTGRTLREPAPNDPIFQEYFLEFIAAFGARYNGHPDIDRVGMTGGSHQGETVFNEAAWSEWWPEYGLDAATLAAAWATLITKGWRPAFSAHLTTLGIDPEPPFPTGGEVVAPTVALCHQLYGNMVNLQQNGLRSTTVLSGALPVMLNAASAYTAVGWQEYLGSGKSGPLSDVLKLAWDTPADYVEVYLNDCLARANQAAISQYGNPYRSS